MVKCVDLLQMKQKEENEEITPKCEHCISTRNHCVETHTLYCVECGDSKEYVSINPGVGVTTPKKDQCEMTCSVYCSECKAEEESVEFLRVERVLTKNESLEQAVPTTEQSRGELTDDFFDDFSSDDSEEYESNFETEKTPLWWFDECEENSVYSAKAETNIEINQQDHGEKAVSAYDAIMNSGWKPYTVDAANAFNHIPYEISMEGGPSIKSYGNDRERDRE